MVPSRFLIAFLALFIVGCSQLPFTKVNDTPQINTTPPAQISVNETNITNSTPAPQQPTFIIPPLHPGNLTIYYIDVGQGDSIFVVSPNNKTLLIDCGPKAAGSKVVEFVRNLGFATIDYGVVSHQHDDHIGGCPVEFFKLKPSKIYDNGKIADTQAYRDYTMSWSNNHEAVSQDKPFEFDLIASNFIVPYDDGQGFSSDESDNSLLVRLLYGNQTFLFTGDCNSDCEARIINSDVQANVLKVGHHGSKYSTSILFLNYVKPSTAVIFSGTGNQYGHPNAETLEKLNQRGTQIFRTDQDGSVVITTDGSTIGVEKVKG